MRRKLDVHGIVQGVGMRPWVASQARRLGLSGTACNTSAGLTVVVEGDCEQVEAFQQHLRQAPPSAAVIDAIHCEALPLNGGRGFTIQTSLESGLHCADIPKDRAMCTACREEQRDPGNRRYRHAFISCVSCGPRFSIIHHMPFDRNRTAMQRFPLCSACEAEYGDPDDRRYHAQTVACLNCGPRLALQDSQGTMSGDQRCLEKAAEILARGGILGVKGVGGYQLLIDAARDDAIARLRRWKHRQRKPLAIMCRDAAQADEIARLSTAERQMLESAAAPIVIVSTRTGNGLCADLAPGLNTLGVMLPASPLHQLLADDFQRPLIVTSGNRPGEPTLIDDGEAREVLLQAADALLLHDRPIEHTADDSVVRMAGEHAVIVRHARGFAPSSFTVDVCTTPGIAFGGHMKCAPAFAQQGKLTLLQHIGDADSSAGQNRMRSESMTVARNLFGAQPQWSAGDLHPDYGSSQIARALDLPFNTVPHHAAHVLSLVAEQQIELPVTGVAFDGTGLGPDGTLWGGEFIHLDWTTADPDRAAPQYAWQRTGTLLGFPLPGGEAAIREPRRAALGMAWRLYGGNETQIPDCIRQLFTSVEWRLLISMLASGTNCPQTSSVGRLFDALSACMGLCTIADYDGEAAIRLEHLGTGAPLGPVSAPRITNAVWDWRPLLTNLLERVATGAHAERIAADFHTALSDMVVNMVTPMHTRVLLSGGVFQNVLLLDQTRAKLCCAGKQVYTHRSIPPNDGALALGQVLGAARNLQLVEETPACV